MATDARGALLTWLGALLIAGLVWSLGSARIQAARSAGAAGDNGRLVGVLADPLHVSMQAVYGAFVREAMDGGGLRVHNAQTTDPHAAELLRPYEFALGTVGRAVEPADPARFAFELERACGVLLFVFGLTALARVLLTGVLWRLAFVVLGCTAGNLFVVVRAFGGPRAWLDTHMPHLSGLGFSYPAYLLGVPHIAAEVGLAACAMAGILGLGRAVERAAPLWRPALLGGAGMLGVAMVRPYTAPVLWLVSVVAWYAARPAAGGRRAWLLAGLLLLAPAPPMLLAIRASLRPDSIFGALDVVHPSPPLIEQLLFFGVPAFAALALFVLWPLLAQRFGLRTPRHLGLLLCWLLLGTLLANAGPLVAWEVEALAPIGLTWLALCLVCLEALWSAPAMAARALALGVLGLAASLGLWSSLARDAELMEAVRRHERHLWLLPAEASAVDWLREQRAAMGEPEARGPLARDRAEPGLWVEPSPLATLIPWLAGTRVFLGHPDHTPDAAARLAFSQRFRRDGKGLSLLEAAGVTQLLSFPFPPEAPKADPLDGREGLTRLKDGEFRIDQLKPGRRD